MRTLRIDEKKLQFLSILRRVHGTVETITRPQIIELVKEHGSPDPSWLWQQTQFRVSRGVYRIPPQLMNMSQGDIPTPSTPHSKVSNILEGVRDHGKHRFSTEKIEFDENYDAVVPPEDPIYEAFGNYYDVETITLSGKFYPYWIFGLSGNGKTLGIEQAHARNKKKWIPVPITKEADEDSLLGGLRLVNGETQPFFGPVTLAALLGVTCLLDEIDLGDEKMMCLQTPLQNKPYLIKRLGKMIYPKPGFNLCATANTKGKGNEDGKFVGTNIMNEAMLDRFVRTFEQDYPNKEVEQKILLKVLRSFGHTSIKEEQFVDRLILWAEKIRQTYNDGAVEDVITTRRLVHICQSYDMFGKDREKAIKGCIARFDAPIKVSFWEFYEAIDKDAKKRDQDAEKIRRAQAAELARQQAALAKGKDPETVF